MKTNKHTRDTLKAFREEFQIHFKNAPDELIFACVFLEEALREERAIVIKEIEKWEYNKTNYMTMMASKKNYDIGILAREIKQDLINKLKQK